MRLSTHGVAAALVMTGLMAKAAPADAASLRIRTDAAVVSPAGRVSIALHNPGRRVARGTLSLRAGKTRVGTAHLRVPARRTSTVRVKLTAAGVRRLARSGRVDVIAVARGRKLRTAMRAVVLLAADSRNASPPAASPSSAPPPPVAPPKWHDGRYHGRYQDNNAGLAFNIASARLYSGPFDAFYVEATCRNVNPGYTGPDQVYPSPRAVEPLEAAIASDGSFQGQGRYEPGTGSSPISWAITGQVVGGDVRGKFAVAFTDAHGNPCAGETSFAARQTSPYVIGS